MFEKILNFFWFKKEKYVVLNIAEKQKKCKHEFASSVNCYWIEEWECVKCKVKYFKNLLM